MANAKQTTQDETRTMVNLNQIRAGRAFGEVKKAVTQNPSVKQKDFLSLARSLPAMFQQNGLLATWAFLLAKSKKKNPEHEEILKMLYIHLTDFCFDLGVPSGKDYERVFTEHLANANAPLNGQFMRITAEAINFSGWIKRAAEALCQEGG